MKKKICIIESVYNKDITEKLSFGAHEELKSSGIKMVDTVKVPGAFEIPGVIARLAKKYDAFVAVGCVIKGETANFDLICSSITNGIMQISINEKKPIGNGIITSFNRDQAFKRTSKGKDAARAVLDVLKIK
tara:strand:+ start:114 stop:509 length:396 start_codon:yes stop_codon:yes gene_type:complete